jgi:hypothetical protein
MGVPKRAQHRMEFATAPLWWGMAGILSVGCLALPQVVGLDNDDDITQMLLVGAALFLSGVLIGHLRPGREWQWAIASFLAFAARDVAWLWIDAKLEENTIPQVLASLGPNVPGYLVHSGLLLIGAYMGTAWRPGTQ